jgi:hypothetical protein
MIGLGVWTAVQGGGEPDRGGPDGGTTTTSSPPPLARRGSEIADPAPDEPLAVGAGPAAYTIRYALREPGRPETTETVEVERPYRSRRTGPTETTVTDFARLQVTPGQGAVSVLSPPPAAVDPRPALVVDRAVAEGLLEAREWRRVLDRPCRVHRGLSSVSSSTISAALPGRYTDTCVGEDGLILEEWQVFEGRAVRQRIATEISTTATVEPIVAEPTLAVAQGGGSVLRVDPASEPPGTFYVLDRPPAGLTLRGRYAVVPPQPGLADESERRRAIASTADVYEQGADVLVVDRGATLNQEDAFQPRPEGRPVDLGPLGAGELLLSWTGPEVRVKLTDGRFVRVFGTLPVDAVVEVARSLRETPGGSGLVYLDRPAASD